MKNITCYLIDDNEEDRGFFISTIGQLGSSIICLSASNCAEALKAFNDKPALFPDYIFLDLNLPLMKGPEGLEHIRAIQRLKEVPIIVYSTSSNYNDVSQMKTLGAKYYLVKPYNMNFLVEKLAGIFKDRVGGFVINQLTER